MSTILVGKASTTRFVPALDRLHAFLDRIPASWLALGFRFAVAGVFWKSGMTKLASWDLTVALFENEYAVPLLPPAMAAYLATAVELVCPLLLVLGFGTRLATAVLLAMTLVIQVFVYPENWSDHLLWGVILAYLVARGGGSVSIDAVIGRVLSRSR